MTDHTTEDGAQNASPVDLQSFEKARELALRIADIVTDTPAADTVVLDIHELSSFSDFFLICSGENERQLRAISEEIGEELSKDGRRPNRVEGTALSGWIVLDYGDVIVHIFDRDQRDFYRIEQLWGSAPRLLSIQ